MRSLCTNKKVNTYWNYSAYFNFKTQLLPGYEYFKKDGEDVLSNYLNTSYKWDWGGTTKKEISHGLILHHWQPEEFL